MTIPFEKKGKWNSFDPKDFSEFSQKREAFQEPLELDKVKIIQATGEQKGQYSKHMEGLEFSDMPKEDFPFFSKEQLDSVPNVIEGFNLTEYDKKLLLLNELREDRYGISYKIDSNNNLTTTFLALDRNKNDLVEKTKFITKEAVQFNKEENKIALEPLESDKVKVIPPNKEQSLEYSILESFNWKTFAESFSNEQMNAIPNIIEGRSLNKSDKIDLLFNNFVNFIDPKGNEITYVIDNDNNILKKYLDDKSKPPTLEFITKEDVQFNKQEKIVPMIDVYLSNKEGHVYFKIVEKPLEVGDRINLLTKWGDLYIKGEVKDIANGEIELNTSKGIVIAPFDARIEPLFLNDSQNKKINIEYGVNQTITLLDKKELSLHERYFGDRMNDFTDLLKGNKTSVLPFEKLTGKEEGKLQIIKNFEGQPFVSLDLKNPKLNVDAPYIQYGIDHFKLNQEQKEQLKKTGELGLVTLTSNVTNKESKLWVSVDKELNKIVTQKSEAIKINKIFGTPTTEEQKNKLKAGEGILLDIKGTNYFIIASAASKNSDGLRTFTESKAREFKLIPNQDLEQSNKKTSGIKI